MKAPILLLAVTAIVCLFTNCGNNHRPDESSENNMAVASAADSTSTAVDDTDVVPANDNVETKKERRFIRTADLKFKVKNVTQATSQIEDITKQFGGFVTYTELNSTVGDVESTPVSEDSSIQTNHYTVINTMTIRVPNAMLDTTLRSIATMVEFLDNRTIKSDDAALSILANKLSMKRNTAGQQRLIGAMNKNNKDLEKTAAANDRTSEQQEASDNALMNNLSLNNQIAYSTINLNIYQPTVVQSEMIARDKSINAYKPSLIKRIVGAMQSGWNVLENIIVFVFQLWAVILLLLLLWFGLKKYLLPTNKKHS